MKRLLILALSCLALAFDAGAQNNTVYFSFADGGQSQQFNRKVYLYPEWLAATQPLGITTPDRLTRYTDAVTGVATVTNMLPGQWRGEFQGSWQASTNWFTIPLTNGPYWASNNMASAYVLAGSTIPAYSMAQSDARYWSQAGLLAGNNTSFRPDGNGHTFIDTTGGGGSNVLASAFGLGSNLTVYADPTPGADFYTGAPLVARAPSSWHGALESWWYGSDMVAWLDRMGDFSFVGRMYGDGGGLTNLTVPGGGSTHTYVSTNLDWTMDYVTVVGVTDAAKAAWGGVYYPATDGWTNFLGTSSTLFTNSANKAIGANGQNWYISDASLNGYIFREQTNTNGTHSAWVADTFWGALYTNTTGGAGHNETVQIIPHTTTNVVTVTVPVLGALAAIRDNVTGASRSAIRRNQGTATPQYCPGETLFYLPGGSATVTSIQWMPGDAGNPYLHLRMFVDGGALDLVHPNTNYLVFDAPLMELMANRYKDTTDEAPLSYSSRYVDVAEIKGMILLKALAPCSNGMLICGWDIRTNAVQKVSPNTYSAVGFVLQDALPAAYANLRLRSSLMTNFVGTTYAGALPLLSVSKGPGVVLGCWLTVSNTANTEGNWEFFCDGQLPPWSPSGHEDFYMSPWENASAIAIGGITINGLSYTTIGVVGFDFGMPQCMNDNLADSPPWHSYGGYKQFGADAIRFDQECKGFMSLNPDWAHVTCNVLTLYYSP
jgi:hypothetical protein